MPFGLLCGDRIWRVCEVSSTLRTNVSKVGIGDNWWAPACRKLDKISFPRCCIFPTVLLGLQITQLFNSYDWRKLEMVNRFCHEKTLSRHKRSGLDSYLQLTTLTLKHFEKAEIKTFISILCKVVWIGAGNVDRFYVRSIVVPECIVKLRFHSGILRTRDKNIENQALLGC